MKLIVGLGNPGEIYKNTRHNIGFIVIDKFLSKENLTWITKFHGKYTSLIINQEKVYFLKPETYMNLSGNCLKDFMSYYKIPPKDILVIQDDLDLPIGKYRLKYKSSAGGHNGIKSIIENLKTEEFSRLKIGISHDKNINTKDYVLGKFNRKEEEYLSKIYPTIESIITDFISLDITELMSKYNGDKKQ